MFCYQPKYSSECTELTSELFSQLVVSNDVNRLIGNVRRFRSEDKPKAADLNKRQLPLICFCASHFDVLPAPKESKDGLRKKGQLGKWRLQDGVHLNGLYMVDIDHISQQYAATNSQGERVPLTPRQLFQQWVDEYVADNEDMLPADPVMQREAFCCSLGIRLVHITSSNDGLRLVAEADIERGNLAENQAWLAKRLGFKLDESCKDASRGSFCPGFEDLLYINKDKLFTYENKEYDEKWGPQYRGKEAYPQSKSLPPSPSKERGRNEVRNVLGDSKTDSPNGGATPPPLGGGRGEASGGEAYHGIAFEKICQKWFELVCKGVPTTGDRHQSLYRLACDLRYITDFDPQLLTRVLAECEVGRAIATERGTDEIQRIAADACALQRYRTIPKRMQNVLAAVGIQLADTGADPASRKAATIDYEAWWHRLEPLLGDAPGYREAVSQLPEHHRLAGVLVAGAMLGTYLSRCWWEHFDGKDYRLSFLVYVVGSAASGKSFIVDLDRLIMAPMLAADRVGREWERQYKEEMKKRAASSKNAKAEAPEQQHPVIRYLPSTISNAMLYRRLTDAIDRQAFDPTGQPLHLHCYTCEPELATALRAQTGSWAGKLDLELKSFHNEYAGVDYANDQSVNGVIQINWNQVVSGTQEAMSRKIKPSTVLDGLVTRFVLFPMPQNDFAMIERRHAVRDHEREAYLRSIGLKLEQVQGELKCDRLVDFCYEYEKKLAEEARLEQDLCLDYFRKRIPVIMMRYTLVRIVLKSLSPQGLTPQGLPPTPSEERGSEKSEQDSEEGNTEKLEKDESNHNSQSSTLNSCVPAVASDQRSSAQLEVTDSDLEFARLIGDWCLMAQMHMFGEMVMEAQERERSNFVPRKRSTKIREAYASLPEVLTTETLVSQGVASELKVASTTLIRWLDDGLVERIDNKKYRKLYKEIPV